MIEPKIKPCKGIGKGRGQKSCGKQTKYRKYGLCQSCYADFILNTDAGKILLEKATIKATKPRKDFEKAKAETKNRHKITDLIKSVQDVCHKYIRLRDKGKPCISCNAPYHKRHQAGHYYKAELFTSIKFHEDNIHGQCVECNIRKEGNLSLYIRNLPIRIGRKKYLELSEIASKDKQNTHKWDREELKEIRTHYNNKIKELNTKS